MECAPRRFIFANRMEEEEKRTVTGKTGHPKGSKDCEGPKDKPKRVFTCSTCGEKGHRKRNELCKGKNGKDDVGGEEKMPPKKKKKGVEEKGKEEEQDDEEEKVPTGVERVLYGDLVLCTDEEGDYFICSAERVLKEDSLEFPLGARVPPPSDESKEVFIQGQNGDEFAEPRFGFYACTVMFKVNDTHLVYIHAMDPQIPASYAWYKKGELLPIRSFEKVMDVWELDNRVDVCRWEWQDNRHPVWCPAVISNVQNKAKGLYSVTYERPLRFKTEEQMEGGVGWKYGKPKEIVSEDRIFFTRLRPHLEAKASPKKTAKKMAKK